jgi:hypothetical protein
MAHSSQIVKVLDIHELSTQFFLKRIESTVVNELTSDLECNLVTPFVHLWHRDIIQENCKMLFSEWEVVLGILSLYLTGDGILEVVWESIEREVDSLGRVLLSVLFRKVHQDDGCLTGTNTTNKKSVLQSWFVSLFRSHVR